MKRGGGYPSPTTVYFTSFPSPFPSPCLNEVELNRVNDGVVVVDDDVVDDDVVVVVVVAFLFIVKSLDCRPTTVKLASILLPL